MRSGMRGDRRRGLAPADEDLSRELVLRIQGGDERAWEDLYLRYRDRLLFSIRCRLGWRLRHRIDSEDILHSVFRDALSDLLGFEPQRPGALEHYLHVCVLNKIRSKAAYHAALKRAGDQPVDPSLLERLPARSPDPTYSDSERYERLERALDALPPHLREVVLLRAVEGLPFDEVARAMDRSPEAASKLYHRAVARLGQALRGWPPPEEPDANRG